MVSSSRSVTFDMAETTTATGCLRCSATMIFAATRMRSALPMLVPPNFMTNRFVIPRPLSRSRHGPELNAKSLPLPHRLKGRLYQQSVHRGPALTGLPHVLYRGDHARKFQTLPD